MPNDRLHDWRTILEWPILFNLFDCASASVQTLQVGKLQKKNRRFYCLMFFYQKNSVLVTSALAALIIIVSLFDNVCFVMNWFQTFQGPWVANCVGEKNHSILFSFEKCINLTFLKGLSSSTCLFSSFPAFSSLPDAFFVSFIFNYSAVFVFIFRLARFLRSNLNCECHLLCTVCHHFECIFRQLFLLCHCFALHSHLSGIDWSTNLQL